MLLQEYETTVVVRPDVSGDGVESTLDRIRDAVKRDSGMLLAIDHGGKKKLAYEIKKHTRGIYVRTHYLGNPGLVGEIERNMRINENVLRFLTVKLAADVDPSGRTEQDYVKPEYDKMMAERDEERRDARSDAPSGDADGEGKADAPAETEAKADAKPDTSEAAEAAAPAAEAAPAEADAADEKSEA